MRYIWMIGLGFSLSLYAGHDTPSIQAAEKTASKSSQQPSPSVAPPSLNIPAFLMALTDHTNAPYGLGSVSDIARVRLEKDAFAILASSNDPELRASATTFLYYLHQAHLNTPSDSQKIVSIVNDTYAYSSTTSNLKKDHDE